MPRFYFRAVTSSGEVREGQIEEVDRAAVIARIQAAGQIPIRADEVGSAAPRWRLAGRAFRRTRPVRSQAIAFFTQALASLLRAGLPLDRALEIMRESEEEPRTRRLIEEIQRSIHAGAPLSTALGEQQGVFSRFYLNMIRTAEAGGRLDEGFSRLVEYLERSRAMREQMTSAMIYPALLLAVTVISVALIFAFVVPRFEPLFADLGDALPSSTRLVLATAHAVADYGWLLLLSCIPMALLVRRRLRSAQTRERLDRRLLQAPLIGTLIRKLETARFTRSLGTLLDGGVPLLEGLAIARETVGNRAIRSVLSAATDRLKDGGRLSEPLLAAGIFPTLALQMIKVGEETGRLDSSLLQLADIYDREVATATQRLLSLLEPALIIGLGLLIAMVIMSILVGIVSVNELPV